MMVVPLCCSVRTSRSELGGVLAPMLGGRFNGTVMFAIQQTEAPVSPPSPADSVTLPATDLPPTCGSGVADHRLPASVNPILSLPSGTFGPKRVCQRSIRALRAQRNPRSLRRAVSKFESAHALVVTSGKQVRNGGRAIVVAILVPNHRPATRRLAARIRPPVSPIWP